MESADADTDSSIFHKLNTFLSKSLVVSVKYIPLHAQSNLYLYSTTIMRKIIFSIALLLSASLATSAQENKSKGYYTQYYGNNPQLIKEAEAWAASGAWQNGFTKARPHHSVNLVDFYLQYQKNPEQWKALFEYLAKTDLLSIPGGKHKIPSTSLVVMLQMTALIAIYIKSLVCHLFRFWDKGNHF